MKINEDCLSTLKKRLSVNKIILRDTGKYGCSFSVSKDGRVCINNDDFDSCTGSITIYLESEYAGEPVNDAQRESAIMLVSDLTEKFPTVTEVSYHQN